MKLRDGRPLLVPLLMTTLVQAACGGRVGLDDDSEPTTYDASQLIGRDASGEAAPASGDAATRDAGSASRDGGLTQDATTDGPGADSPPPPPSIEDGGLLAQCTMGGNRLYVYGDPGEITHVGPLAFGPTSGSWGSIDSVPSAVQVGLGPNDMSWGDSWEVDLTTEKLGSVPLTVQRYDDVQMPGSEAPGHAGMFVQGGWQECVSVSGWFQIEQIAFDPSHPTPSGSTLTSLTVTFEQSCNGESAVLRGCLHYEEQ